MINITKTTSQEIYETLSAYAKAVEEDIDFLPEEERILRRIHSALGRAMYEVDRYRRDQYWE